MNLQEIAALTGKTIEEVKEILEKEDVIELKLTDKKTKEPKERGTIEIMK